MKRVRFIISRVKIKTNKYCCMAHRLDVTVQEADGVDALDGLQDLAAQTQGGADAEGSPAHTAPQVSQVTTLREQKRSNFSHKKKNVPVLSI